MSFSSALAQYLSARDWKKSLPDTNSKSYRNAELLENEAAKAMDEEFERLRTLNEAFVRAFNSMPTQPDP